MIRFLYPDAFWFLLLPFVIFWVLPKVQGVHGGALRTPFLDDLKNIKNKAVRMIFQAAFFYGRKLW